MLVMKIVIFASDSPITTLKLGRSANIDDLRSGMDIVLGCLASANPPVKSIHWKKDVSVKKHGFKNFLMDAVQWMWLNASRVSTKWGRSIFLLI